ncbi:hypothetical protein [Anaplasma bovis]|uniref:hypothetical protein n=1 Tax=Anaplasma bovis TaxID=186733 RepID=UPI002FF2BFB6
MAFSKNMHAFLPSQYKVSCAYSLARSEPFGLKYRTHIGDWDVNIAAMLPIFNGKLYYHELEFNSSKLSPVLSGNEIGRSYQRDVIDALLSITGAKHLAIAEMENILSVKELSLSYGLTSYYMIGRATSFYISSAVGLVKIVQYQGFRRYTEDLSGSMMKIKFGISYRIKPGIESYVGYSYRKDFWKYETDIIYDEDGNSVSYAFEDFKFPRYGFEIGVKFLIS